MDAAQAFAKFNQRFAAQRGSGAAPQGARPAARDEPAEDSQSRARAAAAPAPTAADGLPQATGGAAGKQPAHAARPRHPRGQPAAARTLPGEAPSGIADALGTHASRRLPTKHGSQALSMALSLMKGVRGTQQAGKAAAPPRTAPEVPAGPARSPGHPAAAAREASGEQALSSSVLRPLGLREPKAPEAARPAAPAGNDDVLDRLMGVRERLKDVQRASGALLSQRCEADGHQAGSHSRSSGSPALERPAQGVPVKQLWHAGVTHEHYFEAAKQHLRSIAAAANGLRAFDGHAAELLAAKLDGCVEGLQDLAGLRQASPQQHGPERLLSHQRGSQREGHSSAAMGAASQRLRSLPVASRATGPAPLRTASLSGRASTPGRVSAAKRSGSFGLQVGAAQRSSFRSAELAAAPSDLLMDGVNELMSSTVWGSQEGAGGDLLLPPTHKRQRLGTVQGSMKPTWTGGQPWVDACFGAGDLPAQPAGGGSRDPGGGCGVAEEDEEEFAGFNISPSFVPSAAPVGAARQLPADLPEPPGSTYGFLEESSRRQGHQPNLAWLYDGPKGPCQVAATAAEEERDELSWQPLGASVRSGRSSFLDQLQPAVAAQGIGALPLEGSQPHSRAGPGNVRAREPTRQHFGGGSPGGSSLSWLEGM